MTSEEKELLLKDLCARLPYGVRMYTKDGDKDASFILRISDLNWIFEDDRIHEMYDYDGCKPYLRPMSSMTEDEEISLIGIYDSALRCGKKGHTCILSLKQIEFLNSHHFDYRGLVEKGLALEALEGMYDIKQ